MPTALHNIAQGKRAAAHPGELNQDFRSISTGCHKDAIHGLFTFGRSIAPLWNTFGVHGFSCFFPRVRGYRRDLGLRCRMPTAFKQPRLIHACFEYFRFTRCAVDDDCGNFDRGAAEHFPR